MANHKSAIKKIRADKKKAKRNRFQLKSCKKLIKDFKNIKGKDAGMAMLPKVISSLDKLGNKNIIPRNKAARQKSSLYSFLKKLA